MTERFAQAMNDPKVRHDTRVLASFTRIYCRGNHGGADRSPAPTDAASAGVYGPRPPVLCAECAAHLAYGEKRCAYCPKDPKPFCAHCDSRCYSPDELEWQRRMMRYSGPRSWYRGHLIDAVKHLLEGRRAVRANA